ncbi:MAG: ABC transporter ATP-binding protein [Planctomycetota bacterium]
MAEIQLRNVGKRWGSFVGVDNFDLTIADQEFLVLLGPSGCGKTTTMRMIAGLEDVTEGEIAINGRVVNDLDPKDRDIAMVFQSYALYPNLNVYENIRFPLKVRKTDPASHRDRVMRAAEMVELTEFLHRRPAELSGGQRQRVALARAIVREPNVFLMDEPLSNLDAKLRVETRAEIKRLHKRLSTTTIYVTHDQEEAMTLGDRVVLMSPNPGLIQQCDTPLNMYEYPVNRFVAAFLGTPPMNFIDGRIEARDGQTHFVADGVDLRLKNHQAELVQGKVGQDVVLGIRPEGLFLQANENANDDGQTIPGVAGVIEPLGNTMDVFVNLGGGQRVTARVKAEVLDEDTPVTLHIDDTKLHIFEPGDYGVNLTLQNQAAMA